MASGRLTATWVKMDAVAKAPLAFPDAEASAGASPSKLNRTKSQPKAQRNQKSNGHSQIEQQYSSPEKPRRRRLSMPGRERKRNADEHPWPSTHPMSFYGKQNPASSVKEVMPAASSSATILASPAKGESEDYRGPVTNDVHFVESSKPKRRLSLFRRQREKAPPLPAAESLPLLPPSVTLPDSLATGSHPLTDSNLDGAHTEPKQSNGKEGKYPSSGVKPVYNSAGREDGEAAQIASPRQRQEAHRDARLTVKQTCYLVDLCAQEIKMRGLATVGIFRPFRLSESPKEIEHLIELFLLSRDPAKYSAVFVVDQSVLSGFFAEAFGKKDPDTEFRRKLSYANIHDVVAVFKWGLRRLDWGPADLGGVVAEPLAWYETFAVTERTKGYPERAFNDLLIAGMSKYAARLIKIVLDVASTISAHHVANAMPAWRISRILGYWLFGRVATEKATPDLKTVLSRFEQAGQIMEHMLLVFVRDQASQYHYMPLRLTELIDSYPTPHLQDSQYPRLILQHRSPTKHALCVESNTINVILTPKHPRRLPREIIAASLLARASNLESSEVVDDWMSISNAISGKKSTEPLETLNDDGVESDALQGNVATKDIEELAENESNLFKEDDVRVLHIVAAELKRRREIFLNQESLSNEPSRSVLSLSESDRAISTYDSSSSLFSGRTHDTAATTVPVVHSRSPTHDGGGTGTLGTLSEDDAEGYGPLDWSAFAQAGFKPSEPQVDDLQLNENLRLRTELGRTLSETDHGLRKTRRGVPRMSIRRTRTNPGSEDASARRAARPREPPSHILKSVKTIKFDETFAMVWQDQLLDDCSAARLPNVVCGLLNPAMAGRLLGPSVGSKQATSHWILLSETIVPPLPPPPPALTSSDRSSRKLLRRASFRGTASLQNVRSAGNASTDKLVEDDRRSLSSIRSSLSARLKNSRGMTKMRDLLRRSDDMSNGISAESIRRKRSSSFAGGSGPGNGKVGGTQSLARSSSLRNGRNDKVFGAKGDASTLASTKQRFARDAELTRVSIERRKAEEEQQHEAFSKIFQKKSDDKGTDMVSATAAGALHPRVYAVSKAAGADDPSTSFAGPHPQLKQRTSSLTSQAMSQRSQTELYRSTDSSVKSRYVDALAAEE